MYLTIVKSTEDKRNAKSNVVGTHFLGEHVRRGNYSRGKCPGCFAGGGNCPDTVDIPGSVVRLRAPAFKPLSCGALKQIE